MRIERKYIAGWWSLCGAVTMALVGCGASTSGVVTTSSDSSTVVDVRNTEMPMEERDEIEETVMLSFSEERDSTRDGSVVGLNRYVVEIPDTINAGAFRFNVVWSGRQSGMNSPDSLAVIDRVEPSCGCIMASVQRSFVTRHKNGEVYVGFYASRMSDTQPYTIDVYTTANPTTPLTLTMRKVKSSRGR